MRVLFASVPAVGHFYPLVPLAWAFRSAGHEVLVAFAEHTAKVAGVGLHAVDVAPDFSAPAVLGSMMAENPDLAAAMGNSTLPPDPTPWAPLFAELNRPLVASTMTLVDDWKPDLVVYEQLATFGLIAAAYAKVPAVQRNLGVYETGRMHEETIRHLGATAEQYGVTHPAAPVTTLEFMPPSMLNRPPEGWFLRFVPTGGGIVADRKPSAGKPRVVVTQGTNAPRFYGLDTTRRIVDAVAGQQVEVVLALGDVDPAPLGDLPANVSVTGWTSLPALLRTADAVVHHGGGGTAMTAADAGLPQLVVLDPADGTQQTTGEAVRDRGIGFTSTPADLSGAQIERLVTDDSFRAAAAEVQSEIRSQPSPADTVDRITSLVG